MANPTPQMFQGMPAIIASQHMCQLMETARRVALAPVTVLITGETGSGKEIVARAVHHFSLRCSKPWVDINCGALPDHLMESELFGHEKGAFSGADAAKPGLFEMAHTGTLFLDEVGELDSRMQVKLLRVLDGVPYYRVGGQRKVAVDVRIVAATNAELERQVEAGRFRSDLYHRLNQCRLHVPPLRERIDDIVPLAEFFLRRQSERAVLTEPAKAVLRGYRWPGNIRELRNVIVHAAITATSYEIGVEHLPPLLTQAAAAASPDGSLRLDGLERDAIFHALGSTGGHQQKAAELLGISRRTLSRKLKTYRLSSVEEPVHSYGL